MNNRLTPFHLAVPVHNLEECRKFYREVLQMKEGRSSDHWVDFDFYGHQFVIHYSAEKTKLHYNPVDGKQVPVPHYGVVLDMKNWNELAERLKAAKIDFIIEPTVRFKGQVGEQSTMFFLDPSGNALEFKGFAEMSQLFSK
ncbi:MAG: VOC family protein [Brumimicrobium sp.]|nr:VOC family protein [Brumimicrobium sp.]